MDVICAAGVPVTVTELSIHHKNVTMRAQQLDEALVIAMAAECTNAIVLWGFSDQPLATMMNVDYMSLFDGERFEVSKLIEEQSVGQQMRKPIGSGVEVV